MRSRIDRVEDWIIAVVPVHQNPIEADMAFHIATLVALELVIPEIAGQFITVTGQNDYRIRLPQVVSAPGHPLPPLEVSWHLHQIVLRVRTPVGVARNDQTIGVITGVVVRFYEPLGRLDLRNRLVAELTPAVERPQLMAVYETLLLGTQDDMVIERPHPI